MEFTLLQADDQRTHVKLTGRLDVAGVNKVTLEFSRHVATRRKPTVVDLSGVDFIASLGMGMLVTNAKALHRHSVKMILADPKALVEEALRSAGIDALIPIAHGPSEVAAMLGG
jgi:anti-anti-sigma factor